MRFIVEVRIGNGDRPRSQPIVVGVIERSDDLAPASGLGLLLQETKDLSQKLQTVMPRRLGPFPCSEERVLHAFLSVGHGNIAGARVDFLDEEFQQPASSDVANLPVRVLHEVALD